MCSVTAGLRVQITFLNSNNNKKQCILIVNFFTLF